LTGTTVIVFDYVIVGGGRAGASAVEGIRELDNSCSILMIGAESHLPYDRPPLSKQLWLGKNEVTDIFVHDRAYFERAGVELASAERVAELRPDEKTITTDRGRDERYGKLLLATGGTPRRLQIPCAELEGVCYFRTLDDYIELSRAPEGKSILVVGGGFIGSEIAAALSTHGAHVTMVFPGRRMLERVFPEALAGAIQEHYEERGIRILSEDAPVLFARRDGWLAVETRRGGHLACDSIVVGVGIEPEIELARSAGLPLENGIEVNELLESSVPGIFAAGDNANFPYLALGKRMRVEHWDNAVSQGKAAGRNMTGAGEPFDYMPYFYSDLFDFGYEAVGDVSSSLETFADWQEENETGVVYYLEDGHVRGVMLCNVWGKLDEARALIRSGVHVSERDLHGAVHA
jgi:3-phenylpropionate/trans-cinnamate dioxygenase ferredoxin reductase subunit